MPRRAPSPAPEPKRHSRRHGAGSIVQVNPTTWRAFRPPGPDGRRQSGRFATPEAAARWLDGVPEPDVLTVGGYLARWLALRAPTLRGRTRINYLHHLEQAESLAGIPLAALSADDCQAWLNDLLARYSRHHVAAIRIVLRAAMNHAVRRRLIEANPFAGTTLGSTVEQPPSAWRADELAALRRAAAGTAHAVWLDVAVGTGLRLGELRALEWTDVDLEQLVVTVSKSLDNDDSSVGPTKTGRIRRVDLPAEVVPALVAHRARQRPGERLVFGRSGRPITANSFRVWLKRCCKRAGVRRLPVHSLRHSFASLALDAGVPVQDVASALGHASVATTLRTYAHALGQGQRRTATALGALLGAPEDGSESRITRTGDSSGR